MVVAQIRHQLRKSGPVVQRLVHLCQQPQPLLVSRCLLAQFGERRQRLLKLACLQPQTRLGHADCERSPRRVLVRRRQVLIPLFGVAQALRGQRRAEIVEQRRVAVTQSGEQLGFGLGPVALGEVGEALDQGRARAAGMAHGAPVFDVLRDARQPYQDVERQRDAGEHHQQERHEQRERHLDTPRCARDQYVARVVDGVQRHQHAGEEHCQDEQQQSHGAVRRPLTRRRASSEAEMSGSSAASFTAASLSSSARVAETTWVLVSKYSRTQRAALFTFCW